MFAPNVDHEIGLHPRYVVAAGARPGRQILRCRMSLEHMLGEPTLLNEALGTLGANMLELPEMFLHVIEHRVLALLDHAAVGADKLPLGVANVGHLS